MTSITAPTSPAITMANLLEGHEPVIVTDSQIAAELRRLHAREQELEAENQRLIGSLEAQRLISDRAIAPESGPSAQLRQPTLKECDEHLYE